MLELSALGSTFKERKMKEVLSSRIQSKFKKRADAYIELMKMKGYKSYSMTNFLEEAIDYYLLSKEGELIKTIGLNDRLVQLDHIIERSAKTSASIEVLAKELDQQGLQNVIEKGISDAFKKIFPFLKGKK